MQSKYTRKDWQEIELLDHSACVIFFYVPLYKDYLPDVHKEFQEASTHDTDVEHQIRNFCYNLFWVLLIIYKYTHTYTPD